MAPGDRRAPVSQHGDTDDGAGHDGYPGEDIEDEDADPDAWLVEPEDDEEALAPPEPPRRWATPPRQAARTPRAPRLPTPTSTGTSSWLHAPREGFTARQAAKADELSNSQEGRKVRPRELDLAR